MPSAYGNVSKHEPKVAPRSSGGGAPGYTGHRGHSLSHTYSEMLPHNTFHLFYFHLCCASCFHTFLFGLHMSRTQAKDGTMNLSETLEEVLRIINCTPDDVRRFVQQHPPEKRLTKLPPVRSGLPKCRPLYAGDDMCSFFKRVMHSFVQQHPPEEQPAKVQENIFRLKLKQRPSKMREMICQGFCAADSFQEAGPRCRR
eukprot:1158299-Pelagomonas_calceolata.AAC.5